ncbi:MAG: hypothetical protein A3J28_05060 [Acidobacteria bacterium RIFCSPLOWO2_12_FULL_60_22]|nr:MAG: hypothetical protein A3J28_05060 [Acidobacteria bacterium RIFCSPLOWO2_12_FULL_60_22]
MKIKNTLSAIGLPLVVFFGYIGTCGPAFAEKPSVKPIGQVILVDSKGKIVGHAMGGLGPSIRGVGASSTNFPLWMTVLLKVEEQLIAVAIAKDRFFGGDVYFDSPNCQGTPWLPAFSETELFPLLPPVAIGPPGHTVYQRQRNVNPTQVDMPSHFNDTKCFSFSSRLLAIPAQALVDLDTVFTPPFSIRTAP